MKTEAPVEICLPPESTPQNRAKLTKLEKIVLKRKLALVEISAALEIIHRERLYLLKNASFAEYCEKTFGWSRFRGIQLIAFAEDRKLLADSTDVDKVNIPLPESEAQTRPLKGLPKPAKYRAYRKAVGASGGRQPKPKTVKKFADEEREERKAPRGGLYAEKLAREETKRSAPISPPVILMNPVLPAPEGALAKFAADYRSYWSKRVSIHTNDPAPGHGERDMNTKIESLLAKHGA